MLGTDYETYTAIYSCEDILGSKVELAWINTRTTEPDQAVVSANNTARARESGKFDK